MAGRITIKRAAHNVQNRYFLLLRATAQNSALSFEARGMLIYLLSKPDDWQLQIADLMREGSLGRNRVYRLIKELVSARYIARTFLRDDKKQVKGVIYLVHEEPYSENQETTDLFTEIGETATDNDENLFPRKLETGNQDTGFGDSIQNTDSDTIQTLLQNTEAEDARAETETPAIVYEGLGMTTMAALSRQDAQMNAYNAVKGHAFYVAFLEAWRDTLPADKRDLLVPEVKPSDAVRHQDAIEQLKLLNATPEQVRKVVAAKRAAGKHEYPFPWLPKDVKALQVSEADGPKPAPRPSPPSPPPQPGRRLNNVPIRLQDAKKLPPKEEDKSA